MGLTPQIASTASRVDWFLADNPLAIAIGIVEQLSATFVENAPCF
jgi:hypothetical protein